MPIQNRLSNSAPECNGSTGTERTQGLQVGSHCGLRYHASGHAFFLSRKASQFTHEYFMYAKVKMLLLSSRFVCVILALSLHENPRQHQEIWTSVLQVHTETIDETPGTSVFVFVRVSGLFPNRTGLNWIWFCENLRVASLARLEV